MSELMNNEINAISIYEKDNNHESMCIWSYPSIETDMEDVILHVCNRLYL